MSATIADQPLATPVLSYDGRIGDLYRIFLVNLLLTIITLGIWRFWAVTRMRRYVWSRTSSFGQRFEYDGTGAQLFVGFLLAVGVVFGLGTAAFAIAWLLARILPHAGKLLAVLPIIMFELAIVALALGAPFSAQRYRLNHTIWRGIRGGVRGSMLAYGLRSLLYILLVVITFYQLSPWAMLRLYERRTNASFFGTQNFAAATRGGAVYLRFLLAFIGVVILAVAVFGTVFVIERPVVAMLTQAHTPLEMQRAMNHLTPVLLVAYLVLGFGGALISAGFTAAYFRHITGHTRFGALRFSSQVGGMAVLVLTLGNIALLVFTLGLGMPVVIHRNLRFMAANLWAAGRRTCPRCTPATSPSRASVKACSRSWTRGPESSDLRAADAILFDGKTALGVDVFADIEGGSLRLTSADGAPLGAWDLGGLMRCDHDAPSDSATFRHAGPERLTVTDAALLAELRDAGVDFGRAETWSARRWLVFGAGFVGSLLLGALLIDQLPGLAAPLVPPALERGWSTTIQGVLSADAGTCDAPEATAALTGLVARLSTASGLARPPRLTVLDTGLVNAFTLPDGRILLLRGLIDKAGGPDELAGVLAHELGHVRRHDPTREMLRGMALNMVARSLGRGSSVASEMAALSYGRRAEAAADASAVVTLHRAGLRTDGLRRFFARLHQETGDGVLPFLSDHPATSRRIAALPSGTAGTPALTPTEWRAVQEDCRPK